jgi:hypothetical protein
MKAVRRIDATEGEAASGKQTRGTFRMFQGRWRFKSRPRQIRPLPVSPFGPEMAILAHDADFRVPVALIA